MTLPDDLEEKWEYKEHTKVKHEILSKYLTVWINILGTFHKLYLFDCFAGRGIYSDGEQGSPLKIIQILENLHRHRRKPKEAECFFIEKNQNNYENLKELVDRKQNEIESWLKIHTYQGIFSEIINELMEEYNEKISPGFFFIDPFGFGGIPLKIIKKLLSIEKTEVFITFMIRDVIRFLESTSHQNSIKDLYGIENVIKRLTEGPYKNMKKEEALLKLYRDQLHKQANVIYTFSFKVNTDEKLQTTYYLIHCTNHPKGCMLMKAIMYSSGTEGKFGYFGPAEGQLTLDLPQFGGMKKFKAFLVKKFKNRSISFIDLQNETLMDTRLIEKHYRQAIRELEKENKIYLENKGPKGGIKPETVINFREKGALPKQENSDLTNFFKF